MHEQLTVNDFEDPLAKQLFIILEECSREEGLSIHRVLNYCQNEELKQLITKAVSSKEFEINNLQYVQESIRNIRKQSLERQGKKLLRKISDFKPVTPDDHKTLAQFLAEKMEIDRKLQE